MTDSNKSPLSALSIRVSESISALLIALTSKKKIILWASSQNRSDLLRLKDLVAAGDLRSIIDRSYALEKIAEAHAYVDSGKKTGNVAITIGQKN